MSFTPPPPPTARERARQKLLLQIVIGAVLVGAGLIVIVAKAIPLPFRLFIAATDLAVAAVLALVLRQKFRD